MAPHNSIVSPDLIYRSPRPPLSLPNHPHLDMVTLLLNNTRDPCYSNRLALIDASTGDTLTFSQMKDYIKGVARSLWEQGIRQQDVVLMLSPNSVHFPVVFFAILSLGAVATTVNPVSTEGEIIKQMNNSGAMLVVTVPELLPKVKNCGRPIVLIGGDKSHKKDSSISLLSELMRKAKGQAPAVQIRQTDTAALLYSSGTTGVSKGVVLSHQNFISSAIQVNSDAELCGEKDLTFLCVIPMFHVYGLAIIVYAQLQRGNSVVTMPKFAFIEMLEAIQKYRITNLPLVPPIVIALAKQEAVAKFDLSSVKELTSGAAPVGREIMEEVSHRLSAPDVRQGYGMTETSGITAIAILKSPNQQFASTGPLVPCMEAVVIDPDTGKRLPPNKQGELWVRGPNVMQGYLNNPEATAATLDKDGWLHTGDLVYIDEEGNLYIVDRLKELIKYKGLQVAPAELEALLLSHPQILDAAVVPLPNDIAGEVPMAYIVRAAGSSLSETDVIQFVASQVAPYKKVRKVKFVNVIPKSSSGKILRRELVQQRKSKL